MSIIQALHDSEINCSVSTFYDGCFTVKLGDEMNGFKDEAVVSNWNEAVAWLDATARLHYPESDYARCVDPRTFPMRKLRDVETPMRDIAKIFGVSRRTVSRVLRTHRIWGKVRLKLENNQVNQDGARRG